jgi:sterol desaturase/sphingolipid hydroxylase (fatty acid hydroxylase superfamily)
VVESQTLARIAEYSSVLFPASFFALAICEALRPARAPTVTLALRWFGNIGVFLLGLPILLLIPFLSATGAAVIAREHGLGVLNVLSVPPIIAIPVGVVALDFAAYWEHRLVHFVPAFWRLHALHHTDTDLDVASYVRHHPFELVLQTLFDVLAVIALGLSPLSVAVYSAIGTLVQMAAHGNVELPKVLRWVSLLLVTPEMHRLHHSQSFEENNSNFSDTFPVWDRMFGTLRLRSQGELKLGLPEFTDVKFQRLDRMLLLPLLIRGLPVTRPEPDLKGLG